MTLITILGNLPVFIHQNRFTYSTDVIYKSYLSNYSGAGVLKNCSSYLLFKLGTCFDFVLIACNSFDTKIATFLNKYEFQLT